MKNDSRRLDIFSLNSLMPSPPITHSPKHPPSPTEQNPTTRVGIGLKFMSNEILEHYVTNLIPDGAAASSGLVLIVRVPPRLFSASLSPSNGSLPAHTHTHTHTHTHRHRHRHTHSLSVCNNIQPQTNDRERHAEFDRAPRVEPTHKHARARTHTCDSRRL